MQRKERKAQLQRMYDQIFSWMKFSLYLLINNVKKSIYVGCNAFLGLCYPTTHISISGTKSRRKYTLIWKSNGKFDTTGWKFLLSERPLFSITFSPETWNDQCQFLSKGLVLKRWLDASLTQRTRFWVERNFKKN